MPLLVPPLVRSYVNPFLQNLSEPRCRYVEALAADVLLRDAARGAPVSVGSGPGLVAGELDLSTARGVAFAAEVAAEQLRIGASGWMADYGEYVPPFDAAPASGRTPLQEHNAYPLQWQQANQAAVEGDRAPERDVVWFARSSGLTSPSVVPLFWLGDQLHSWDAHDGLASTVVGLLSSGLSGHALTHSDTGGFTTVSAPSALGGAVRYTRSVELLQRWTELNTFTAVLRSHEGSQPDANAQPYDHGDALAHFARFSRLFASLAPYRRELLGEAATRGTPLVRPLWLHYEADTAALDLDTQFLLGQDLLVAPVIQPNATCTKVYLPAGTWLWPFTNATTTVSEGGWVDAYAPVGQPAVLLRLPAPRRALRASLRQFVHEVQHGRGAAPRSGMATRCTHGGRV